MASSATERSGCLLVANPGSRAAELFQRARMDLGYPPAELVPWWELLAGRVRLEERVRPEMAIRLESPGRDFPVERALLALGATEPDELDPSGRCDRLSAAEVRRLSFDRGRVLCPRQWFLGFRFALRRMQVELSHVSGLRWMNRIPDLLVMFDKPRCHAHLGARGVPVPAVLGGIHGFDALVEAMRAGGLRQVFVKLAHGSSASGTLAYRTSGGKHRAYTTVEHVVVDGEARLYNTRKIRMLESVHEIAGVVNALCRHHVHVEEWLPKAGIEAHTFDLRVVTIGGRARHTVVRKSRTPITNLHLLNPRGEVEPVRARMGEAAWQAATATCEATARCFPHSLHAGIDLAILTGYRRHAVLEVNGFGDLLPGVLHDGEDTYTAELRALDHRRAPAADGEREQRRP